MTTLIDVRDRAAVAHEADELRRWGETADLTVALVYGGLSAEDRLYITESPTDQLSVTALGASLSKIGARFAILDPCEPDFIPQLLGFDVVLANLHGPFGEDGRLQGLLDYLRKPYCGSGVAASAVAADKVLCKQAMRGLQIPTPDWAVWTPGETVPWDGRPVMVKPPLGGSSLGMSLVRDEAELEPALRSARSTDHSPVLIEEYLAGLPVTVGLLQLPGGLAVFPPLAARVHAGDFYDAATKLDSRAQGTVTLASAETALPTGCPEALTQHAVALWDGLGLRGAARIDFIVDDDGHASALEVNSLPGMSWGSNFITGAGLAGLTHEDAVRAFLHEALSRRPYDVPLPRPEFRASTR